MAIYNHKFSNCFLMPIRSKYYLWTCLNIHRQAYKVFYHIFLRIRPNWKFLLRLNYLYCLYVYWTDFRKGLRTNHGIFSRSKKNFLKVKCGTNLGHQSFKCQKVVHHTTTITYFTTVVPQSHLVLDILPKRI